MSVLGTVPVFDCKSDEWPVHVAQLNSFFVANDITDTSDKDGGKRRAILLNCMSQDSYRLIRDLLHPEKPENVSYKTIVDTLNAHFEPKKCVYAEREKFYDAKKESGESLMNYAARLRGLASTCKFGTSLEMSLTDRFVMGVDSSAVREKLYREDPANMKLSKALEISIAAESAHKIVRGAGAPEVVVKQEPLLYAAASAGRSRCSKGRARGRAAPRAVGSGGTGGSGGTRCGVCGAKSHASAECGFRHLACDICGVKGHLKRMCTAKKSESSSSGNHKGWRSHYICDDSDSDEYEESVAVNNLKCTDEKPLTVEVSAHGCAIGMEVDSGSGVSALPAALWRRYFATHSALGESNKTLRTYGGSIIKPIGVCELPITYNGTTKNIRFFVVEDGPVPLLGRDFMSKFNFAIVPLNYSSVNKNEQILNKYSSLFSGKLGTFNKYKLSLHLREGATPRFFKARPVPFALKDKVGAELDRMVRVGILKPVSYSKYASPIVAVLKKNNGVRICGDYSVSINKDLKIDSYPLPKINELCASLHNCRYFSKIDLSNSYNQFLLDDQSQEYTCINTHKGLFVYTRLVFGLANAPALFQRAMVQLLHGIEGVQCFLDDVLISAPTREAHWERVDAVMSRLSDAGLMLQRSKCSFFQDKVEYLGYVIDRDGVHKCPEKVKAIVEAKVPENSKQLKSFLGLVNFYRSFIPQAATILEPLHGLLRKDVPWNWAEEHQKSFDAVKKELSSRRVLAHWDPQKELVLTVDAGPAGLGAVLAVRYPNGAERPLCYASRALSKSERAYSQIMKEATAIVYGIKKYHQYLYGRERPFILRTDHKPLLSIFSPDKGVPQMTEARLQRYALFLGAYNYKIEYVSSEKNVADYLSQHPVDASPPKEEADAGSYVNALAAAGAPLPASLAELRAALANDKLLSEVSRYVANGWPRKVRDDGLLPYHRCRHELHVDNGSLLRGHRIVIPTVYRPAVLQELHAAHLGIVKMKLLARERCWYPGIDRDIEKVAADCDRCISMRTAPARANMESWEWPRSVFERIHLDFLGPFHGKIYMVLIDAHSKWLECVEMPSLTTQMLINKLQKIFSHFGLPKSIVTDNAKTFVSTDFSTYCVNSGITHILSPTYSPQSNGLAENAVKICKRFITNARKDGPLKDLKEKLDEYLFHYRITPHCTTGVSPATLMFGRNIRCKLDLLNVPVQSPSADKRLLEVPDRVRLNQARQKINFGGRDRTFKVNDQVWVKDYRSNPKKPTWILGKVDSRVGKVVYDVSVLGTDIVWRRHVNQLLNANSYDGHNVEPTWTYDESRSQPTAGANGGGGGGADASSPRPRSRPAAPNARADGALPHPRRTPPSAARSTSSSSAFPHDVDDDDTFETPPSNGGAKPAAPSPLVENDEKSPKRTRSGRPVNPPKRLFY
ncbi:uncharacterized protein K02A2.6-like [Melitaea cinxia]|uniref:uncharacterized protein K02A2.6-like n=1 Tax=Melitaea cinxia TaxID=113334 RepID=UPI001E27127E|nr:uncharacterized protein K02A2.6-like [Melitaea cinxia]